VKSLFLYILFGFAVVLDYSGGVAVGEEVHILYS